MALKTITFRLPEDKLLVLDSVAAFQQRDRSFLLNEAVNQYLSLNDYHHELIEEGLRQDEAGELMEHKTVLDSAASRLRKRKAR